MKSVIVCALLFIGIVSAQTWGSAEFYNSADCSGDYSYDIYKLNQCFYDGSNYTYPYRTVTCASSVATTLVCYDSTCTTCVTDGVYPVGQCAVQNDGTSVKAQECSDTEPTGYDGLSGMIGQVTEYSTTGCSGEPYLISYTSFGSGCDNGVKYECGSNSLDIQVCSKNDCSGSCTTFVSFSTTCASNATEGTSEVYACFSGASSLGAFSALIVAAIALAWF